MIKMLLPWGCLLSFSALASSGINCQSLPAWSASKPQVNLHHIFCGEINKKGRAVGYHSNPNGKAPSTYLSHEGGDPTNPAGIYVWDNIRLKINGSAINKPLSSMFPNQCSKDQVIKSVQYSATTASKHCNAPGWAKCGLSAPTKGARHEYCLGTNGSPFIIATATNYKGNINTGFPLYQN